MKGVGILLIVVHNLAHTLGVTGYDCNEYNFEQAAADALFYWLQHPSTDLPIQLSTLLGYCGIYIFLFLSAFGLVRKYEQSTSAMPAPHIFIWKHYKKLFSLMILGLVAAIAIASMHFSSQLPLKRYWIAQALMISNWFSPPYRHVFPGPYWFLGLMVELYIIYRLILYVPPKGASWRRWLLPIAFAIVCLAPQFYYIADGRTILFLRYNFFVASLSFAAGLLVARYGRPIHISRRAWAAIFLLTTILFVAMQKTATLWLLSSLVAAIAIIASVKMLPATLQKPLVWTGAISAHLFIVHPVVRLIAFEFKGTINNHLLLALYLAASLLAATLYSRLHKKITQKKK